MQKSKFCCYQQIFKFAVLKNTLGKTVKLIMIFLIKMSNYSDLLTALNRNISFSGWAWLISVLSGKPESLKWYEHNGIKYVFILLYNE